MPSRTGEGQTTFHPAKCNWRLDNLSYLRDRLLPVQGRLTGCEEKQGHSDEARQE